MGTPDATPSQPSSSTVKQSDDVDHSLAYQYPHGHLGHLDASQHTALETFTDRCRSAGFPEDEWNDAQLLRFLRARRYDIEAAFEQITKTKEWRSENAIDELYNTIDIDEYEATRKLYPQWTGRRDRRGMPLYVFAVGQVELNHVTNVTAASGSTQPVSSGPPDMLRLFALFEHMTQFVTPWATFIPSRPYFKDGTPITQTTNIVDLSGMGIRKFWSLKNHLQQASQLSTAHYPETLDRIFILGAPSFFSTIWSWVKRWFDPIVVSKIYILSGSPSDVLQALSEFVDPQAIPKKYGGELDWWFGDAPVLDDELRKSVRWSTGLNGQSTSDMELEAWVPGPSIPMGPLRWQRALTSGETQLLATGSKGGTARSTLIGVLVHDSK